MAEYIDRVALEKAMTVAAVNGKDKDRRTWAKSICVLHDIPTVDLVPVVHGRWIEADWVEMESGGHELIRTPNAALRCSNCRCCFKKKLLWKSSYCPNCGAKMDKKEAAYD